MCQLDRCFVRAGDTIQAWAPPRTLSTRSSQCKKVWTKAGKQRGVCTSTRCESTCVTRNSFPLVAQRRKGAASFPDISTVKLHCVGFADGHVCASSGRTCTMLPSSSEHGRGWEVRRAGECSQMLKDTQATEIRGNCGRCTQALSVGDPQLFLERAEKHLCILQMRTFTVLGHWLHPKYRWQSIASVWHRAGNGKLWMQCHWQARGTCNQIDHAPLGHIHILFSALNSFSVEQRGEAVSASTQNEKDSGSSILPHLLSLGPFPSKKSLAKLNWVDIPIPDRIWSTHSCSRSPLTWGCLPWPWSLEWGRKGFCSCEQSFKDCGTNHTKQDQLWAAGNEPAQHLSLHRLNSQETQRW